MNGRQIVDEVSFIVQDSSYDEAVILGYVNHAIAYVGGLVRLPSMKSITTVDTELGQAYTSLASLTGGFSGHLRRVVSSTYGQISIYPTLDLLMDDYASSDYPALSKAGAVEAVAAEGSVLWYQYVPAVAETLTVMYYKVPASINLTESPDDFPEFLHRKLFVHGAAWMIFDQIEDDVEAGKGNTATHFIQSFDESSKNSGLIKLREWIGMNKIHHISSVWRY